jgi:Ca2+-binding EF-hand superfamily protein
MAEFTEEELEEIKENFAYFDADNNGQIDYEEFTHLIDGLGGDMSSEVLHIGFKEIDTDHNGFIDFEECFFTCFENRGFVYGYTYVERRLHGCKSTIWT